ncbi:flagellar basal body rod protein FlgB [Roseomonas sp. NAR14]|uniref:Flagellar basal body rod protein FlgB n=1 Tax=Roseomonas acroporae TaxID=2937791 RepID=A0A9X1Y3E1_9PROT|nr:flagellar basal body rod protein FlgB [Roseomonas acroporae]MCK8782766.1 flagellar basal body rod protein FlgB [Roseomonas acroporae]
MSSSPTAADPIALAERRLQYLDRRQQVLARNVANADTPGYRAQDLQPFAALLAASGRSGGATLTRTSARHLEGGRDGEPLAVNDADAAERSPDGNTVTLDRQAIKVAETDSAHALATSLRTKYLGLFRAALGRGA